MHDDRVENDDGLRAINDECSKYGQAEGIAGQLKNQAFVLMEEEDKDRNLDNYLAVFIYSTYDSLETLIQLQCEGRTTGQYVDHFSVLIKHSIRHVAGDIQFQYVTSDLAQKKCEL